MNCPRCGRPAQAGFDRCMYCGAAMAGPAGSPAATPPPAAGSPRLPGEPDTFRSLEDVMATVNMALKLAGEGRTDDACRLMTRVVRELALGDLKKMMDMAAPLWLSSVSSVLSPEALARAKAKLGLAAMALYTGDEAQALKQCQSALSELPVGADQHPMVPLLGLGLKGAVASAKAKEPETDDERYSAFVNKAVQAMMRPEGQKEAIAHFEAALALVPDPPETERDKTRRARVLGMLSALRKGASPSEASTGAASAGGAAAAPGGQPSPQQFAEKMAAYPAKLAALTREGMFWNPEDWFKKGMALFREQDYVLAIHCMDQVLAVDAGHLPAIGGKGCACLSAARVPPCSKSLAETAAQCFRKVLERKPGDPQGTEYLRQAEDLLKQLQSG